MLKEKPWQLHLVLRLVAGLCACVALSFLIVNGYANSRGVNPEDQISVLVGLTGTLIAHGVGLLLINVFLKQHQLTWAEAFGVQRNGASRALLLGWFMAVLMLPVSWSLNLLSGWILEWFNGSADVQSSIKLLQKTQSFGQLAYFGVVAIVFAPVFEELVFRGILYPFIKRLYAKGGDLGEFVFVRGHPLERHDVCAPDGFRRGALPFIRDDGDHFRTHVCPCVFQCGQFFLRGRV